MAFLKSKVNNINIGDEFEYIYSDNDLVSLIKLGYIGRIDDITYKKLKNLPKNITYNQLHNKSKDLKIPIEQRVGTWNKLVCFVNEQDDFDQFTIHGDIPGLYYGKEAIKRYLNILHRLGYIKITNKYKKYNYHDNYADIEKLKPIPFDLSSSVATKMAYGKVYNRLRKIEYLKEKINNS